MAAYLRAACLAYLAAMTEAAPPTKNIVELAESVPDLSILVQLVVAADLATTLEGKGPFTVFAPPNAAFQKLGNATLQHLLDPANKAELVKILTYHVLGANVQSKDLKDGEVVATVEGDNITVHLNKDGAFINNAKVIAADIEATNGVVHEIDTVLLPPAPKPTDNIVQLAESVPELSILVQLVAAGGLVGTLTGPGPFTVFAPLNSAFEALGNATLQHLLDPANKAELDKILTYHVASGSVHSGDITDHEQIKTVEGDSVTAYVVNGQVYINHAHVVKADVDATNGVVHIIDGVLLPPKA